jgi:hypothetical protein
LNGIGGPGRETGMTVSIVDYGINIVGGSTVFYRSTKKINGLEEIGG